LGLGVAIAVPWYWLQWQTHGDFFIELYFKSQSLQRLSNAVEGNSGAPWYYFIELIKYSSPWLFFLPGGLFLAWKQRQKSWGILVLVGTILFLGTISLMQTKLPWYIMPYYPFFALTVGAYLGYLWQENHYYSRLFVGLFGLLCVVSLGGCIYFIVTRHPAILMSMSGILLGTMGLTIWGLWRHDRRFIPTLLIGMYLSLALFMLSPSWLWELNEQYPVTNVAAIAKKYTPEKTTIYTSFPDYRPSLDFYSDRQILSTPPDRLHQLWTEGEYLLLDRQTFDSLQLPKRAILGTAENFVLVRSFGTKLGSNK
ncbi:MAG: phospholipid carrier-dependent glycosyltransferase, partial [Spirulina sp.]